MRRRSASDGDGWLLTYADLITNLLVFFVMLLGASSISRSRMQEIARQLSGEDPPESLSAIQEEIEEQVRLEDLEEDVTTRLTAEGLEVSLNSGLVFDSGSATIRPEQVPTLDRMLETLVPYADRYEFAIEGHTDSVPLGDGTPGARSNWELSTDRANAVRAQMQGLGIDRTKIRVEGYADTVSLPSDELEGLTEEERLARHRRVIVRVY